MREYITDDQVAARLRVVETELRRRGLDDLADCLAELVALLEDQS